MSQYYQNTGRMYESARDYNTVLQAARKDFSLRVIADALIAEGVNWKQSYIDAGPTCPLEKDIARAWQECGYRADSKTEAQPHVR